MFRFSPEGIDGAASEKKPKVIATDKGQPVFERYTEPKPHVGSNVRGKDSPFIR